MADHSTIEWTDASWNIVTGCDRVSPGCDHCYIERTPPFRIERRRFDDQGRMGIRLHPDRLDWPLRWRKPRRIFTPSLGDLFHKDVPDEFIGRVFDVMMQAEQHTFQVLTKRPQRMKAFVDMWLGESWAQWIENLWLGTSIESDRYAWRADHLRGTPAAVRWLSLEPLLGPLPSLDLTGIDWVVVGGESGPGHRDMHPDWLNEIAVRCHLAGVPLFVKQDSHARSGQQGRIPDVLWARKDMPEAVTRG